MRRFLNVVFLTWFAIAAVCVAVIVVAVNKDWGTPAERPYPVSDNANVQRAVQLNDFATVMRLVESDPEASSQWCATAPEQASAFSSLAMSEGTPNAARAFADVSTAMRDWCTDPNQDTPVAVAMASLFTAVTTVEDGVEVPPGQ